MGKKKLGYGGSILFFLILIGTKFLDNKLGDLFDSLHKVMAKPFAVSILQYNEKMSVWLSVGQFFLLLTIYGLIVLGIVFLINITFAKKKTGFENYEDTEENLGEALVAIANGEGQNVIDEKVTSYMTEIEMEIKKIFNVRKKQLDFIWYFPKELSEDAIDSEEEYDFELVYLKKPKDLDNAQALINSSLDVEAVRIKEENVKGRWETKDAKFEQFITVRNYGSPSLGLGVFIYKENVLNEENEQEFIQFTTNLLLLGFHEQFVKSIAKKVKRAV
ncbi:hypothetical protein [Falsibacillus pallidus]|uniref:Uncharacterized protein n=1 Tax=Falsibacillus pallidus TaxID=493781 RepID=A0A370GLD0_9BACI|nr:hypothetical protein [Falsibacillus pallidus]RDI44066.1 hypothetical protein DFR59_103129 [Falsibacillus pallidus]